jgi:hypothetical protein
MRIPLNIGNRSGSTYDLDQELSILGPGEDQWRLASHEDVVLDGRPVLKLTLVGSVILNGATMKLEYWIDLEHGAIPVQTRVAGRGLAWIYQENHWDIQRAGEQAWYPRRSLYVTGKQDPGDSDTHATVRKVEILEADFDRDPSPALFQLAFDTPEKLANNRHLYGGQEARSVWTLDALPRRPPTTDVASFPEAMAAPVLPGERTDPGNPWLYAILAAVGLAAVVLGLRLHKRSVAHA